MTSMQILTQMVGNEKDPFREQLLYDLYILVSQMITEMVPPLVKQCLDEISVDVRTKLNGRTNDLSGLKDDITRMVTDKVNKAFS